LLLGLGKIGMGYDWDMPGTGPALTHTTAFARNPKFQVLGAVDSDLRKRQEYTGRYQKPAWERLNEITQNLAPDVIVISTPTETHRKILEEVLEKTSPRLVLCEKPIADSVADAEEMCQRCLQKNIMLRVNYPRRVNASCREIKERIADGRISGPMRGVVWYSKGLVHSGSHFLNLLEFWLGPVISHKLEQAGRILAGKDSEPDLQLSFREAEVMFLALPEENFSFHEIQLVAKNGLLRYQGGGDRITWQKRQPDSSGQGSFFLSTDKEVISRGVSGDQGVVADEVARCLEGENSDLCTGEEALRTLSVLEEAVKNPK
jgi:predicted dehydrogenase